VNGTDAQFTVLTSKASAWNLAPLPPANVTVRDTGYSPGSIQAVQAQRVQWTFSSTKSHSVTDAAKLGASGKPLFDSGAKTSGTFIYRFNHAGTYGYRSSVKGDTMSGSVGVPVLVSPSSGTKTTSFKITWSSAALPTGYVEDVQLRFKPAGSSTWKAWSTWKTNQTAATATFTTTKTGAYQFEARLRNKATGSASGYSPAGSITVS
jgi:plastocyanin